MYHFSKICKTRTGVKKTILPFVLFLIVSCVFLGKSQTSTRNQTNVIPPGQRVLTNQEVVIDGRKIQLNLVFSVRL